MSNSPPSSIFQREHFRHAAAAGLLIVVGCNGCKHREAYVASDLLLVYGDMLVSAFAGGRCGKCGSAGLVSARSHYPTHEDVGRLQLRRPVGWQQEWTWGSQWLELPLRELPDMSAPGQRRADRSAAQPAAAGQAWRCRLDDPGWQRRAAETLLRSQQEEMTNAETVPRLRARTGA